MKKILCLVLALCSLGLCSCGLLTSRLIPNGLISGFETDETEIPSHQLITDGAPSDEESSLFGESRWEPGMVVVKEIETKNNTHIIVNHNVIIRCTEDNCKLGDIIRVMEIDDSMKSSSRSEIEELFANGGGEPLNAFSLRYTLEPLSSKTTAVAFYFPTEAADEITQAEIMNCRFSAVLATSSFEAEKDSFDNMYDPTV